MGTMRYYREVLLTIMNIDGDEGETVVIRTVCRKINRRFDSD